MKTNDQILAERTEQFNKRTGARVGDYLKLPYGQYTRFTHDWDDSLQTGTGGSYYFSETGRLSYSGSLDTGVKTKYIKLTDEVKTGWIWFFDRDILGAGRGAEYEIEFRVFELVEGADTSGIPQIKEYERKLIVDQAEKITRINGNGQEYTTPLPEVILKGSWNETAIAHISQSTGLTFEKCWAGFKAQLMKHSQLSILLLTYNFKTQYVSNSFDNNIMYLEYNK